MKETKVVFQKDIFKTGKPLARLIKKKKRVRPNKQNQK